MEKHHESYQPGILRSPVYSFDMIEVTSTAEYHTLFNFSEIPHQSRVSMIANQLTKIITANAPSGVCAVIVPECAIFSAELTTRLNAAGFTCFHAIIRGGKFLGFIPARAFS